MRMQAAYSPEPGIDLVSLLVRVGIAESNAIARAMITMGRICLNGEVVDDVGMRLTPEHRVVTGNGKKVNLFMSYDEEDM